MQQDALLSQVALGIRSTSASCSMSSFSVDSERLRTDTLLSFNVCCGSDSEIFVFSIVLPPMRCCVRTKFSKVYHESYDLSIMTVIPRLE